MEYNIELNKSIINKMRYNLDNNISSKVKEVFKTALIYNSNLLIKVREEYVYKDFLFFSVKTNKVKKIYTLYKEDGLIARKIT